MDDPLPSGLTDQIIDLEVYQRLNLTSVLAELPGHGTSLDGDTPVAALDRLFALHPRLPGVILTENGGYSSMISRRTYMEALRRAPLRDAFLAGPVAALAAGTMAEPLVLMAGDRIELAAQLAMVRPHEAFYDPIVIDHGTGGVRLIDIQVVLFALSCIFQIANAENETLARNIRSYTKRLETALDHLKATEEKLLADIRAREQTELALRTSERRFRELIDGSIQGILIQRANQPLFCNRALASMYGFPSADAVLAAGPTLGRLQGRTTSGSGLSPGGTGGAAGSAVPEPLGSPEAEAATETRPRRECHRRVDGRPVWVDLIERPVDWMGEPAIQVTVVDVTDQVQSQRAERLLREVIDNLSDSFLLADADGEVVFSNRRFHELFDHLPPPEAIRGWPVEALFRRSLEAGRVREPRAIADPEGWLADRVAAFRAGRGEPVERYDRGAWFLVKEQGTSDGGAVAIRTEITALKKAQTEAAAQSERLRAAIDVMPHGILMYDDHLTIELFNQEFVRLWDYPADLVRPGKRLTDLLIYNWYRGDYGESQRQAAISEAIERMRSSRLASYERVLADQRVLEVRTRPRAEGGFVVTYADITERKRAEEVEIKMRERLTLALAASGAGVWDLDLRSGRRWWSPEFLDMVGHDADSMPMTTAAWQALVHPEDLAKVRTAGKRHLSGQDAEFRAQYRVRHRDGRWLWIEDVGRAVRDAEGKPVRFSGAVIDITQRMRAQEAVRESEQRLSLALSAAATCVWDLDLPTRALWWSPEFYELTGTVPSALPMSTESWRSLVHPDDREAIHAAAKRHLADPEREFRVQYRLRGRDGAWIWVEDIGQAVRRADGVPIRFTGSIVDISRRKAAEEALARKSAILETTLETMDQGISMFDRNLRLIAANRRFFELMDFPSHLGAMGTPFEAFIRTNAERGEYGPGDAEAQVQERIALARRFEPHLYERTRPNGAVLEVWGAPVVGGGFVTTYTDITVRRRAMEELRQSRRLLTGVIDAIPATINVKDAELRYVLMNSYQAQLLELGTEDAIGRTAGEVLGRGPGDEWGRRDRWVLETGAEIPFFEERFTFPDGSHKYWLTTKRPLRDDGGQVVHVLTVGIDITERKDAEEALRNNERLLGEILESSPIGVLIGEQGQRPLFWNSRFLELHQVDRDYLQSGRPPWGYVNPDDGDRLIEAMAEPGGIANTEIHLKRLNGSSWWASFQMRRTEFLGTSAHIVWTYDISEQKLAEETLRHAKDQAEAATRAKSIFLATMSHEIRTPMNGVLGLLELLGHTRLDGDQQQMVGTVRESAMSLLRIIDDILDFSKIEAGRLDLERMPLSMTAVVEGVAATLASNARRKGISLISFVDPAIPAQVLGDAVRLRQVFFNLGGNAIKFTAHGRVVLRARLLGILPAASADGTGDGAGGAAGDTTGAGTGTGTGAGAESGTGSGAGAGAGLGARALVRLEIADTGIGITPEQRERLFQPFSQAESSTTRRFGGTGLGLSICRQLIQLMGGTIGVDSTPGQGTTFWAEAAFELPRIDQRSTAVPQNLAIDLSRVEVLTAIADPDLTQTVAGYLGAAGARMALATAAPSNLGRDGAYGYGENVNGTDESVDDGGSGDGDRRRVIVVDVSDAGCDAAEGRRRLAGVAMAPGDRVLLIGAGDRGPASCRGDGIVGCVDTPLRRTTLVRAVAVAAGLASPEPEAAALEAAAAATVSTGRHGPPPSAEVAQAEGRLVLVADDHATNREVIRRQLTMLGIACEVVENGLLALEAVRSGRFGALVTDCHMPEMDGYDLAREIRRLERARPPARPLPIIAITANALQGEADRCLAAGMDDYLSKPVELARLDDCLKRWLPRRPRAIAEPTAADAPGAAPGPAPDEGRAAVTPPSPPADAPETDDGEAAMTASSAASGALIADAGTDAPAPPLAEMSAPIDVSHLAELFDNDPELIHGMLLNFLEASQPIAADIVMAAEARDLGEVRDHAHKLKGASGMIRAGELTAAAMEIERAAKQGDWTMIDRQVPALNAALERVDRYVQGYGSASLTSAQ